MLHFQYNYSLVICHQVVLLSVSKILIITSFSYRRKYLTLSLTVLNTRHFTIIGCQTSFMISLFQSSVCNISLLPAWKCSHPSLTIEIKCIFNIFSLLFFTDWRYPTAQTSAKAGPTVPCADSHIRRYTFSPYIFLYHFTWPHLHSSSSIP